MALDHVTWWDPERGDWVPVSAWEASRIYPYGGVPAEAEIFKCSLCKQWVLFTQKGYYDSHFRHSSKEDDKDCHDRSVVYSSPARRWYIVERIKRAYEYPLKIDIEGEILSFLIGFPPHGGGFSYSTHQKAIHNIIIQSQYDSYENSQEEFIYSGSRLSRTRNTFLAVGSRPAKKYTITLEDSSGGSTIKEVDGVFDNKSGTYRFTWGHNRIDMLFAAGSGRRIPYGMDIHLDKTYYLLSDGPLIEDKTNDSIEVKRLNVNIKRSHTYLYRVKIKEYTKETTLFVESHNYSLNRRIKMIPLWPPYVQRMNLYRHFTDSSPDNDKRTVFVENKGSVQFEVEPITSNSAIEWDKEWNGKVVSLGGNNGKHILYAYRDDLSYQFYDRICLTTTAKEPPGRCKPWLMVTDKSKRFINRGIRTHLPYGEQLTIETEFDGYVEVNKGIKTIKKIPLKMGIKATIRNLKYGQSVCIYQGLDCCWKLLFKHPKKHRQNSQNVRSLHVNYIQNGGVLAPFTMLMARRLLKKVKSANLRRLIIRQAKKGTISMTILRLLKANSDN